MKIIDYLNKNISISRVEFLFTIIYTIIAFSENYRKGEILILWITVGILYYIFFYKEDKGK